MPSIRRFACRSACTALILVLATATAPFALAAGEPIAGAYFTFEPNPPPANRIFHGVLHRQGHPNSMGFLATDPSGVALHRITADSIDVLFDIGCGFLCPPQPPDVIASPFTLPALPAGPHRLRVVSTFGETPEILAEADIVVGAGGGAAAVALPIGGRWGGGVLGAILLAAAMLMLRARTRPV